MPQLRRSQTMTEVSLRPRTRLLRQLRAPLLFGEMGFGASTYPRARGLVVVGTKRRRCAARMGPPGHYSALGPETAVAAWPLSPRALARARLGAARPPSSSGGGLHSPRPTLTFLMPTRRSFGGFTTGPKPTTSPRHLPGKGRLRVRPRRRRARGRSRGRPRRRRARGRSRGVARGGRRCRRCRRRRGRRRNRSRGDVRRHRGRSRGTRALQGIATRGHAPTGTKGAL